MKHRALRPIGRRANGLVLTLLLAAALPSLADIVSTIDEGELGGTITLTVDEDALTITDADNQTTSVKLVDIDQVRMNVELAPEDGEQQMLIDNDTGNGTRQKYARIKLRAGLHQVTIPYWQAAGNHNLAVYVSGPGINGRVELGAGYLRCFRDTNDKAEPSAGKDDAGYRLPELALAVAQDRRRMLTRSRYRLYVGQDGQVPSGVNSLEALQLKRSGTTSAINTGMLNEHNENVGLVYDAFFKADRDGEYKFTLVSDDGSQLYFGQVQNFTGSSLNDVPVHSPWRADLAHKGKALGELKSIADDTVTFHIPLVSDVTIALSHTRSLWDRKADQAKVNRDNEPDNEDTVYLRDKNDPELIRSVSGRVSKLDEASLTFIFRGEERTIARDRVVGLVFKHGGRPSPEPPGMHQVLELQGGQVLPCRVQSISKDIINFQLLGGGQAVPPRTVVRVLRVENGRRIDLTRVTPSAEEAIPYFSLKLPYKVNTNFSGKPIVLYDEKVYARGLAVHSKSRLHYKLKPNCERFQADFGLMAPSGRLGNVTARVLGDGKLLWEQSNITADSGVVKVDVKLEAIERLILEVDFGEGQNVGDRAAWCNPRLIYNAVQE
ncbi:MAG: NPCBM/NEW2 domain-containing protein [Planctomycetota bacterium]